MSQPLPSAFPELPDDPDLLPSIPGGWKEEQIACGDVSYRLYRPQDPDLFLDDAGVIAANSRNDYMPYWAFLWPAAIQMAQAIPFAPWPIGSQVLELGAGVGLVGLAARRRGDRVTFSDYDATALHVCRANARANGWDDVELLQLDWRQKQAQQFPVIVGCEVSYDAAMHDDLLRTIRQMLEPDGICWLGDPGRFQAQPFRECAGRHGFEIKVLDGTGCPCEPGASRFHILQLAAR